MINFIVKNRRQIEEGFWPNCRSSLISISDYGGEPPKASSGYEYRLNLFFDDVDADNIPNTHPINREQAQQIIDFTGAFSYRDISSIVVHCNAGISRSAGVAAALSKIYNGYDDNIIKVKPLYNRRVYTEILKTYMK